MAAAVVAGLGAAEPAEALVVGLDLTIPDCLAGDDGPQGSGCASISAKGQIRFGKLGLVTLDDILDFTITITATGTAEGTIMRVLNETNSVAFRRGQPKIEAFPDGVLFTARRTDPNQPDGFFGIGGIPGRNPGGGASLSSISQLGGLGSARTTLQI